jgi:hypothetical protein
MRKEKTIVLHKQLHNFKDRKGFINTVNYKNNNLSLSFYAEDTLKMNKQVIMDKC